MEKDNIIRRAMRQMPQPELPAGFTPRLMERVRRRKRQHEIYENAAYTIAGIVCIAALAAVCRWVLSEYTDAELRWPEIPEYNIFPTFSLPARPVIGSEELTQIEMWGFIAAAFILLSVCDMMIRRMLKRKNFGS